MTATSCSASSQSACNVRRRRKAPCCADGGTFGALGSPRSGRTPPIFGCARVAGARCLEGGELEIRPPVVVRHNVLHLLTLSNSCALVVATHDTPVLRPLAQRARLEGSNSDSAVPCRAQAGRTTPPWARTTAAALTRLQETGANRFSQQHHRTHFAALQPVLAGGVHQRPATTGVAASAIPLQFRSTEQRRHHPPVTYGRQGKPQETRPFCPVG
jgi:hypothetical protein